MITSARTWLEMFAAATRKLAHAISVVDVRVAVLPLVYVNEAFEQLTGYPQAEAVGRNCRFLQGEASEELSVAELVRAIREQRTCTVKLTNYRKDGTAFVNELSLHPVCDSRGVYRYVVGVAKDVNELSALSERAMLIAVRQLLPSQFPASLNESEERLIVGKYAQESQFVHSVLANNKVKW